MSAFETLHQQQQNLDDARDTRLLSSRSACSQAVALLSIAAQDAYQDRELVLQACNLLMDAIQLARQNIDAYLHLARVFIIFRDDRQALKYLKLAQEYEPEHPDIQMYLSFLVDVASEGTSAAPPTVSSLAVPESDGDILYEELEQYVYKKVQAMMSLGLAIFQPVLAGDAFFQLCKITDDLNLDYQQIQAKMQALAQEMDVLDLQKKMRPLEIMLHRLQNTQRYSERLQAADQANRSLLEYTQALYERAQHNPRDAEIAMHLETLLDQCDQLADEIDQLEAAHVNIQPLVPIYEQSSERLSEIQDLLEES